MDIPDVTWLLDWVLRLPGRMLEPGARARTLAWATVVCAALYLVSRWQERQFPGQEMILPSLQHEPAQTPTSREPFTAEAGGIVYTIKPLFEYELRGMAVSYSSARSFADLYHREWEDYLNAKDVAVIWGENLDSGVYLLLKFSSDSWMAYVRTKRGAREAWDKFRMNQLSNNHLICADESLQRRLLKIGRGDQIRIKGVLAEYSHSDGKFRRGSSTTREDTGNGACETIWVEEYELLQPANVFWRHLKRLTFWLALLSGVACLWFYIRAPVVERYTLE
ncbi:hypothetical protein JXA32_11600 [Candidatus Sumerlaeota bacterium]|nr:hypothetical protein [Candidatus Sumerlaeota bacterium]